MSKSKVDAIGIAMDGRDGHVIVYFDRRSGSGAYNTYAPSAGLLYMAERLVNHKWLPHEVGVMEGYLEVRTDVRALQGRRRVEEESC